MSGHQDSEGKAAPKPQQQTGEEHGNVTGSQRDRRDMDNVSRGSEGERRRVSTGQR